MSDDTTHFVVEVPKPSVLDKLRYVMGGSRGGGVRGSGPPLKSHKNIGFLQPAFNVGSSSARK